MVSPYPIYPTNDGGRVRIRQIATHLAERFDVHLTAPAGDKPIPADFAFHPAPGGGAAQLVSPRTITHLRSLIRDVQPDAVLVEYMWLAAHLAPLAARAGIRLLLDKPDVDTVRFRRARRRIWPLVSLYERLALRLAAHVYAASHLDRAQLIGLGARADRISVVPNGVDTSVFRPGAADERARTRAALGVAPDEVMLFFFGQLSYAPNADAIGALARLMPALPRSFRLFVAGRGPVDDLRRTFGSARVTFLGPVDAVVPLLRAADAVPALVAQGSGTRLKILESLACGVPTVTTPVGAEGLDRAVCGDRLRVVESGDDVGAAIIDAARTAHAIPPARFVETYDWRLIVNRMEVA